MNERLTEDNFLLYCAKRYNNPQALKTEEFIEDLDRIKYIKKLLTRYNENGDLKERLILNHIVILYNCFGRHLAKILFCKFENQFEQIKPFLVMINMLPDKIHNVNNHSVVYTDLIGMDQAIINSLRKIDK